MVPLASMPRHARRQTLECVRTTRPIIRGRHHEAHSRPTGRTRRWPQSCRQRYLGLLSRSPTPAVLLELGWPSLSVFYCIETARVLPRLAFSTNALVQIAPEESSTHQHSWAHDAAEAIAPWICDPGTMGKKEWATAITSMKEVRVAKDMARLPLEAEHHHNLRSHTDTRWTLTRSHGLNQFLHNNELDSTVAKQIARLIVGGQDLRGGDPVDMPQPNSRNCYLFCLRKGAQKVDTMRRVIFECGFYAAYRIPVAN